jgi:hypothetical protein
MTISAVISRTVFSRLVLTTCITMQLAAAGILIAGMEAACARDHRGDAPVQDGGTPIKQF